MCTANQDRDDLSCLSSASPSSPEAIELAASEDSQKGGTETILVAEDHEGLRELVRQTLTSQGYSVILASNGRDAVRMFKAKSERDSVGCFGRCDAFLKRT